MFDAKPIVIDARDHMYGRLASIVAKQLLCGQKVVVVRCEKLVISGSLLRNKVKYAQFRNLRHNTNPKKGPYHFRSPARMFWRTIRGMVPQKTVRGQEALSRLACFEGIPAPYDTKKRMVVPQALKVMRLKPGRKFCSIGRLSSEVGWKHGDLVEKLEAKRKVKSEAFYQKKKALVAAKAKAAKSVSSDISAQLAPYGF